MKQILAIAFLFSFITVSAQSNSLSIKLNGKQILSKATFPGDVAGVPLTAKELKAGGKLQINIKSTDNLPEWKRILVLSDAQGNEVKRMEKNYVSGVYDWNIPTLQALLKKHKSLSLSTYSIPIDENKAALVRVATYQLCTLQLKQ